MKRTIEDFPVQIELDIMWGEMDSFQHVNNIIYFRYFESVRIEYFSKIKVLDIMSTLNIGPILAETHCKFIKPLFYPDRITVGARIDKIQKDRFLMNTAVASHSNNKEIAALGNGLIVYHDYGKKQKTGRKKNTRTGPWSKKKMRPGAQGSLGAPSWKLPIWCLFTAARASFPSVQFHFVF